LVLGPKGRVLPDLYDKLPGRGAHLCADVACFHKAMDRKALGRAFRSEVRFGDPDELAQAFTSAGRQQVKAMLATALRSGWLQAGRDVVHSGIVARRMALVILAEDGSRSFRTRMEALVERVRVPCRTLLTKAELAGFHRGRPVAVVGIEHRGLASRMRIEIDRTASLSESGRKWRETRRRELTAGRVRGKMPQEQAGPDFFGS